MHWLDRIERWARIAPEHPAHISGERTLTYGELARRSNRLAAYLARVLPADRSPIAVIGHKEPEMPIAFLGAVKSGHPYVPLDIAIPAQRSERIISLAGARMTLTPERVIALTDQAPDTERATPGRVGVEDPFYIIFTSGSSGEPKGVVITLSCLTDLLDWVLAEHSFAEQDETFLNQAVFSFDVSAMDLYTCLTTGGTLYSIGKGEIGSPAQLYRSLARSNATVWSSTPSFAQMCLRERTFSAQMMPRLRRFFLAGEALASELAAELLQRFPQAQLWNMYGPTEATVVSTAVRIDRELIARYRSLPIGYPKPRSLMPVIGEDGQSVKEGERGEIIIAGPNVSPGYLGRPDLTARAFFELNGMRAYHSGDWGHYQDGLLFFDGRRDNQIKLHGHRIELGDVEAHLRALPSVRDGVVIARITGGKTDSLAAFVILADSSGSSEYEMVRDLKAQLAERLPAYMIPRRFHFMTAFPMTVNGKADRKAMAERLR